MRPETRAYLKANRRPSYTTGNLEDGQLTIHKDGPNELRVTVDDSEDLAVHILDRAEAARLRDWLTRHLGDSPAGTDMAACAAQMHGDDKRTVAHPECGWCGRDHLNIQPGGGMPPLPLGTTVEVSEDGDWMWGCDHRDCSMELELGRWYGTATGGFTSEQEARQGLAAHLAEAHPTQMGGWPDPEETAPTDTRQAPAGVLRAAADLLEATAATAPHGPYTMDSHRTRQDTIWLFAGDGDAFAVATDWAGGHGADAATPEQVAAHLLPWTRRTSQTLAVWLRSCAGLHEARTDGLGCQWCADEDWPCADMRHAHDIARALLEGQDTT